MDDALRDRLTESLALGFRGGRKPWKCEVPLRPLLDAFLEEMGDEYYPRSTEARRALFSASRAILEELGEQEGPDFIVWACRRMKGKMLDVKSPRSLLWLIPQWRQRGMSSEDGYEARGRYLGALSE